MPDIVIALTGQQASLIAEAQAHYRDAAARYDTILKAIIAGSAAEPGAQYALNLRERTITITAPEPSA